MSMNLCFRPPFQQAEEKNPNRGPDSVKFCLFSFRIALSL
uniref:Uncharacterized protein n=1 Tax=Arundo donax TaxID=35708 RepID=A0A0A9H638_ARUDO